MQPPATDDEFTLLNVGRWRLLDLHGDPLVVVSFTQAQNGSVTRGPGNKLTYLSAPSKSGGVTEGIAAPAAKTESKPAAPAPSAPAPTGGKSTEIPK